MMSVRIINARFPKNPDLQQIEIDSKGIICAINPIEFLGIETLNETSERTIDIAGDWLSLGGVDLQINGGLGLAFPDLELSHLAKLDKICSFLWSQGIDGFLPTIVTTSVEKIQRSLVTIAKFIDEQTTVANTAKVLGVHLEGPFLNYEKRGAHPQQHLLPLTIENIKQVLGDYSQLIKVITLAPELDKSDRAIEYLVERGIVVSLGHSLATAAIARTAFARGASMVTHAFNAMPGLHHRQPGLLGEAIMNPKVHCGLIADGNHICPTMLKILLRASNEEGIFLVSDALAPIGLPDGVYPWDEREIKVTNGTAKLADGTLAGTTLPLLAGVKNLAEWGICNVESAIATATESPRKAIALPGLAVGQPANLLRWHWQENNLSWSRLDLS
ncbi:N-acetylglucosamine-6-phosphate deacetylase [Myxosarcina sp. GI1]|uniref:N-acetylglucosamine-6-phosphate deacetylase n=1 Tax=Myxosarcina sp. GI1 TaxID=1541065 RepID=UPI0005601320|nr:N-acetylglucosamine-6-phosphate deacetylase [Myxosarcina sp. GI1]